MEIVEHNDDKLVDIMETINDNSENLTVKHTSFDHTNEINETTIVDCSLNTKDEINNEIKTHVSDTNDHSKTRDNEFICLTITLDEKFQRTPFPKIQKSIDNIIEQINTETDIDVNININIKTMKVFMRHIIFSCPKSNYYYIDNVDFKVFNKFMCIFHFTMERCLGYSWFLDTINDLLKNKGKLCVPKEIKKVLGFYLKPKKPEKTVKN